jgi:hypothetical protein
MTVLTLNEYIPSPRYDSNPWTEARIEAAKTSAGPWAEVESFNLKPVDADPENPVERGFTTSSIGPTQKWVRVVFVDEKGGEEFTTAIPLTSVVLATIHDVAKRLGRALTEAEEGQVDYLIDAATAVVQEAIEIDVPEPVPKVLRVACVELITRAITNPAGLVSESKTLGSYTHTRGFRSHSAAAKTPTGMELTALEEQMVRRAVAPTQGSVEVEGHINDIFGSLFYRVP